MMKIELPNVLTERIRKWNARGIAAAGLDHEVTPMHFELFVISAVKKLLDEVESVAARHAEVVGKAER